MATTELVDSPPKRAERARHVRFPCLDGYRAIAALAVLITHVSFIANDNRTKFWGPLFARMDAGVAVFFLLSGFLLFRPFVDAHLAAEPGPGVAAYAKRRVLRIYPAYWVAVIVVLVIGTRGFGVGEVLAQLGLVHVYLPHAYLGPVVPMGGAASHPLDQTWTLGTEISFYLFLPLYAAVLARIGKQMKQRQRLWLQFAGLAVLAATAQIYRLVVLTSGVSANTAAMMLVWLPNYLDQFALGMLLAVLSVWWMTDAAQSATSAEGASSLPTEEGRIRRSRPSAAVAAFDLPFVTGVCWVLAALCFWATAHWAGLPVSAVRYTTGQEFERQFLYAATALLLLLPGVFGSPRRGFIRAALQTKPLVWLGLVSYAIYIWHNIVIDRYIAITGHTPFDMSFLPMLAWVAVITVAIASVSYVIIERPALRLKERRLGRLFFASSIG